MNTNPKAKRILCFGDSNTWGYIPSTSLEENRFEINQRWPGILQNLLGVDYEIIEGGLHGRTINTTDPKEDLEIKRKGRNGKEYFLPCIRTHNPLDLVIIMLGKNDLKERYKKFPKDIFNSLMELVEIVKIFGKNKDGQIPRVLILSQGYVDYEKADGRGYTENTNTIVDQTANLLEKNKEVKGYEYFDIRNIVSPGVDGIHITKESHQNLADEIHKFIIL
jgi:lysophospholipase L1-like esterase